MKISFARPKPHPQSIQRVTPVPLHDCGTTDEGRKRQRIGSSTTAHFRGASDRFTCRGNIPSWNRSSLPAIFPCLGERFTRRSSFQSPRISLERYLLFSALPKWTPASRARSLRPLVELTCFRPASALAFPLLRSPVLSSSPFLEHGTLPINFGTSQGHNPRTNARTWRSSGDSESASSPPARHFETGDRRGPSLGKRLSYPFTCLRARAFL